MVCEERLVLPAVSDNFVGRCYGSLLCQNESPYAYIFLLSHHKPRLVVIGSPLFTLILNSCLLTPRAQSARSVVILMIAIHDSSLLWLASLGYGSCDGM